MTPTRIVLDADGVEINGLLTLTDSTARPLVVALHGAGYDARYFSAPGHSMHARLSERGWSMLAITRPGYPASDSTARAQPDFARSAQMISAAIEEACHRLGFSRVIVYGHSVGAAVAVHVAAGEKSWSLAGMAITGIGEVPTPAPLKMVSTLPPDIPVLFSSSQSRYVFYGPDETLGADGVDPFLGLLVRTPPQDMVEVNTTWQSDFIALASRVSAPVYYAMGAHDALWIVSSDLVDATARRFINATFVEHQFWTNSGHNIEHHIEADQFASDLCNFFDRASGTNT